MIVLIAVNCSTLWTTIFITASSSDSSSNVTLSWQNDRETTSSTSDWTNTTPAAAADNSTGFEDNNATTAMLTTSEPSYTSLWQYRAFLSLYSIAPPIFIVIATVGNTLSLITLQNPTLHHEFRIVPMDSACRSMSINSKWYATSVPFGATLLRDFLAVSNQKRTHSLQNPMFHKSSTSFILSTMAFCDLSMVNITLLHLWIVARFKINIRRLTSFGCKFHLVLTYYSHDVRGTFFTLLLHKRYHILAW